MEENILYNEIGDMIMALPYENYNKFVNRIPIYKEMKEEFRISDIYCGNIRNSRIAISSFIFIMNISNDDEVIQLQKDELTNMLKLVDGLCIVLTNKEISICKILCHKYDIKRQVFPFLYNKEQLVLLYSLKNILGKIYNGIYYYKNNVFYLYDNKLYCWNFTNNMIHKVSKSLKIKGSHLNFIHYVIISNKLYVKLSYIHNILVFREIVCDGDNYKLKYIGYPEMDMVYERIKENKYDIKCISKYIGDGISEYNGMVKMAYGDDIISKKYKEYSRISKINNGRHVIVGNSQFLEIYYIL
ncbi:Hypothetical protein ORPV_532 [Orpheovirus IHUMI-LCC2]|uniref:Uncharacterized protein n=1 Tax=Orpheovirus IHUMI-LCC2 TaxID=2023057 RepID=A0A2I2L4H6_9VIRU|nr:Hypothetical protein ORPV_532 [Orpheovirus IHUMI-LCC2]SNW62436.1 Hypothetical protein ORPV_532 [Orpheovirus IHUMI-LCC2]